MTAAPDPGRHLLDKIDAREQALTCEAGEIQARIGELTARLRELEEAISDLQVTRKTLIALAGQDDSQPAFAGLGRPLRARDLRLALDLPVVAKNTENIRSKLKRLASRGILIETESGSSAQPCPQPSPQPSSQDA